MTTSLTSRFIKGFNDNRFKSILFGKFEVNQAQSRKCLKYQEHNQYLKTPKMKEMGVNC